MRVVFSTLISVFGTVIRHDRLCLIFYFKDKLWSRKHTLNTICNIIWSPAFPGYLPAMLAAVRSNILAPVSVQMQCTNIFFPTPRGPATRTDFTKGAFSCTAWDPEEKVSQLYYSLSGHTCLCERSLPQTSLFKIPTFSFLRRRSLGSSRNLFAHRGRKIAWQGQTASV